MQVSFSCSRPTFACGAQSPRFGEQKATVATSGNGTTVVPPSVKLPGNTGTAGTKGPVGAV